MHEGGRLYLKPVVGGTFTLDEVPGGKDLVMVATGTGLGPYISMLRHFRGEDRWRKFVIVHGVRKIADLGYRDELEAAAKSDASVLYLPTVTREGWPGLQGRVQDVLFTELYLQRVGAPLSPEQCHVFLCGNPEMVKAVESELVARGFRKHMRREPGNIHKESYW
jgi:ferredoxin--NADP+ reductase